MEFTITEIILLITTLISVVTLGVYLYKNGSIKKNNKDKADELSQMEKEFEQAEQEFIESVKNIDKQITETVNKIQIQNTVLFDCPCNHENIAVSIDLSAEENTFVCPNCKNEYRVDISMMPILKGKIVDETNLYNLLSNKTNNPFKQIL